MEQKISNINVSMLQMSSVVGDVGANCNKVHDIIKKNLSATDVLVLPEVWTVGWSCPDFCSSAQDINSSSVIDFLKDIACSYNVNIIGGSFITKSGDKYFNSCPVIDRKGNLIAVYNKMHLYSYYGCDEGKFITCGQEPIIVGFDGVNFGISICYDIRFPELYRSYRKAGADILVNCAAWGSNKPIPWEMMTKSRAIENQCYMIALTQSGHIKNDEYNLGESRIIDYKGDELACIMHEEGIVSADLHLDLMYDFRNKCTILNDVKDNYEVRIKCVN